MPTPRRIHRTLLSLACATLLLGGLVVTAAPARAVIGIIPTLKCVMYDRAQNQVTATFGYLNANSTAQSVPLGSTNFFSPGSPNQGQPTTFLPGSFPSVFTVTWSLDQSAALSWTLLGTTVTATAQLTSCTGRFAEKPSLVGVPTVGQSVSVDLGMFVPSDQPYDDPAVDWTRDCDTASPTLVGSGTSYAVQAGDAGHRLGAT
ncbi:MAG TPA: hypothetical protein VFR99_07535, partial [Marmoricola sp.]|nr:hypothetical protein [Marmoricola sp.]